MNPGKLRHRITFQEQPDIAEDVYTDLFTVWASVEPISGKQLFAAEMAQSEVTHKICIRYRTGVSADLRIKFKDRQFGIESVINPQERDAELQLMCKELL